LLLLVALAAAAPCGATPWPEIAAMASQVSEAACTATVTDLVAFGTRYSGTPGCSDAARYLADALASYGLAPRLEGFTWGAQVLENVSARHVGRVRPDDVWLVVAHYDSTSESPMASAPGADDNASGVACVLEAAHVLSQHRFEATVEFLLTAGEEQGLLGSDFDAQDAVARGELIRGVVNHDMVGYWPTGWGRDLDVDGTPLSGFLVDAYVQAAADYVPGMPVDGRRDWGVCDDDQLSYDLREFPALIVMDCYEAHLNLDGETTPHYHRTSDLPGTLDFPRLTRVCTATTTTLATLAVPVARTLLRNDALTARAHAGAALRPGDPAGGDLTRIDPAHPATAATYDPRSPAVASLDGEWQGDGARGTFVFYETDRDESIRLRRGDGDGDGRVDVIVTFAP
jgi:hypothetical protein